MTEGKKCKFCGEIKAFNEFYRDKTSKDGRKRYCRDCARTYYNRSANESREYVKQNPEIQVVAVAKQRAKRQGVYFDLKPEDIFIPEVCPILETPLQRGTKAKSDNSPSLDRIDPRSGYIKGNVWCISAKAQRLKMSKRIVDLIIEVNNLIKQKGG